MAINTLNTGVYNQGEAVSRIGFNHNFSPIENDFVPVSSSGEFNRLNVNYSSFGTGTGFLANSGTSLIFDSSASGFKGALSSLYLLNAGPSGAYVGVNNRTVNVNDGILLTSGQSINLDARIIRQVWVRTTGVGQAVIHAFGPYSFNRNAQ